MRVYYCRTYYKAVCGGQEGDSGGNVHATSVKIVLSVSGSGRILPRLLFLLLLLLLLLLVSKIKEAAAKLNLELT